MPYLLRSGSLANYVEVARSAGLNPHQLLAEANLSRYALLDTEMRIPVAAVSQLLEASASSSGQIDFGLRMALDSMVRYLRLHNEALSLDIEESREMVTVKAELHGTGDGGLRQSIELVVQDAVNHGGHAFPA